ncbi:AsmA-like C-terminal domain-containing protein [uncultured Desulfuromonas sp.]|uniref:YhdP family protein n=1 Tax=uncultured Desulfuromonas sp. TaxID=181013 RepID=UPI00262629DD|nr:AsmA-like C-terminal domain-containing protein [uncultured Desulfuromonas sp.]
MFRRHPILLTLAALLVLGTAALALFLLTFDLNRYRDRLQSRLAETLDQPVRLGSASLSMRHGPAFDFADLAIGPGEGEDQVLRSEHLLVKLEWRPLLDGQVVFSEVVLEAPHISITLPPASGGPSAPLPQLTPKALKILKSALVRSLRVEGGTFHLIDRRDPRQPFTASLENLEGQITSLSLDSPIHLGLTGSLRLAGASSPFQLTAETSLPEKPSLWPQTTLQLLLEVRDLATAPLLAKHAPTDHKWRTSGLTSLRCNLSGSPASGLTADLKLAGKDWTLHGPKGTSPLPLGKLHIRGTWRGTEAVHQISDLFVEVDGTTLAGELSVTRKPEGPWLDGTLSSSPFSLSRYKNLLPADASPPLQRIRDRLTGGIVQLESASFAGLLTAFADPKAPFPLQEALFSLRGGELGWPPLGLIENLSAVVSWSGQKVSVTEGQARILESPLRFSGSLGRPREPDPDVVLEAAGEFPAGPLMALLPESARQRFSARGPLPASLKLAGTPRHLTADIKADLTGLEGGTETLLIKPAGLQGDLFLTGEITPDRLELSHGRLHLPPIEARASGALQRGEAGPFSFALDVIDLDMVKARAFWPVLEKLQTRGSLSLHHTWEGSGGAVTRKSGSVDLRHFGVHLTRAIGDIEGATGQLLLQEDRLVAEGLSARIGTSPVEISGSLTDFAAPRIDLKVRGKSIRANDLIFRSEQAVLRDVDGHLVIDRNGIDFAPVRVRLDGGTDAVVRGTLRNFSAPQVILDIGADYGNIDEVIGLWQGPDRERDTSTRRAGEGKGSLLITARAEQGHLGNLVFEKAEGEIRFEDNVLAIHPLHFRSGPGICSGQVVLDGQVGPPSLLKISGHVENFAAATIHQDLLKRRSLVTGKLKGDFFLQGSVGKDFLPTSFGGFNVRVEDGVLRKFPFLSKVFSLLNVSQILSLRLPDMALEGMPFERLKGTAVLNKGVLATEDLYFKSPSMNLTLVGDMNLTTENLDFVLGVQPLRTVDKIITNIPIAGWLLTGDEKALVTAHFRIKGNSRDPEVYPIPITSVSEKVLGIFRRLFELPGKVVSDLGEAIGGEEN